MKLKYDKVLDVQRIGGSDDSIEANIDKSSLPFVFDMLSKQLYSNPIGSIVREITSNCFDSHKEAGIDDPVIIRKTYDAEDQQYYIEFQDFGVGISPDRVKKIYMNYFSSTKRDTDDLIGGFGLGSKSPLSYSDLFYILTRFEGIEYNYVFHKGETKPTLDLIYEEETTERNGTSIRIPIKNQDEGKYVDYEFQTNDCYLFKSALKNQLVYFDNVFIEDWGIDNDYKIYEGEYFKFRSNILDLTADQKIHICIGSVAYPINFKEIVGLPTTMIPIGVKFNIGELPVTPSREEIRYTDESKKLIKERAEKAIQEVAALYSNQNPEIEDLSEFLNLRKSRPKVTFGGNNEHFIILNLEGIDVAYKYSPLSYLNLKKTPKRLFFEYDIIGHVEDGKYKDDKYEFSDEDLIQRKPILIEDNERVSKYAALYISDQFGSGRRYIMKKKTLDFDYSCKCLGLSAKLLGKAKVLSSYTKTIANIVKDKFYNYSLYKPSNEWIEEYKANLKLEDAAYLRRQAKKVFVRHFFSKFNYTEEILEYNLIIRTGITIYGFRDDKEELMKVGQILTCKASFKNSMKAAIVIQLSKSCEKLFKDNKKAIHVSKFYDTKMFRKIVSAKYLNDKLDFDNYNKYKDHIREISKLKDKVKFAYELIRDYNKYNNPEIDRKAKEKNIHPFPEIVKLVEELRVEELGLSLIDPLYEIGKSQERDIVEYLKFKGIKLVNKFYLKSYTNEQTIQQNQQGTTTETTEDQIDEDTEQSDIISGETEVQQESEQRGSRGNNEEGGIIQQESSIESGHEQQIESENNQFNECEEREGRDADERQETISKERSEEREQEESSEEESHENSF